MPHRAAPTNVGVEVHLGTIPERAEEAVLTKPRHRHGLHTRARQHRHELPDRRHGVAVDLERPREVVLDQPEITERLGIECQDHNPPAGDAPHLREPRRQTLQW